MLFATMAWAHSAGAPDQAAGVPGEGLCVDCHGGVANSGAGSVQIALLNATNWSPGQQLRLRITLTDATQRRWGFELTARKTGSTNTPAGTFTATDTNARAINTPPSGLPYMTHTTAGTRPGTVGPTTWEVLWTPPPNVDFGNVTFYAAGNAANNNGQADTGDHIYTTEMTVAPGAAGGATTTKVLPQFVFGGGWYTAIYLSNTTTTAVSVKTSFFGESGTPLNVPNVGTTITSNLPPRGTAVIEAANTGPLTQGWASVDLPDGVIGYAVFRQSQSGVPDQEAVVPFSNANKTTTTLVFDETDFVTGVGILNPSSTATTATMTARGPDGEALGTSTMLLAGNNKTAIALQLRPEFTSTIIGKRGSVDFTVPSGAISVLGLRFKGAAFTSIPTVDPAAASGSITTKVLPQFVFGGGWYTAIYLSNTTGSTVAVKTSFFGEDGAALEVPNVGSTTTSNLAPRGTAVIEAVNTGALTQGWVAIDLPDGVIGYAVFRQSQTGVPDQEAVVPFSSASTTKTTLVFDETDFVTGVGILNPSSIATTVTMTARGPDGATLGTSTLQLGANNKTAIALQARPEFTTIIGKRGSVDFTVSGGAVSVLGLRFKGAAFTSIPPVDR